MLEASLCSMLLWTDFLQVISSKRRYIGCTTSETILERLGLLTCPCKNELEKSTDVAGIVVCSSRTFFLIYVSNHLLAAMCREFYHWLDSLYCKGTISWNRVTVTFLTYDHYLVKIMPVLRRENKTKKSKVPAWENFFLPLERRSWSTSVNIPNIITCLKNMRTTNSRASWGSSWYLFSWYYYASFFFDLYNSRYNEIPDIRRNPKLRRMFKKCSSYFGRLKHAVYLKTHLMPRNWCFPRIQ